MISFAVCLIDLNRKLDSRHTIGTWNSLPGLIYAILQ